MHTNFIWPFKLRVYDGLSDNFLQVLPNETKNIVLHVEVSSGYDIFVVFHIRA